MPRAFHPGRKEAARNVGPCPADGLALGGGTGVGGDRVIRVSATVSAKVLKVARVWPEWSGVTLGCIERIEQCANAQAIAKADPTPVNKAGEGYGKKSGRGERFTSSRHAGNLGISPARRRELRLKATPTGPRAGTKKGRCEPLHTAPNNVRVFHTPMDLLINHPNEQHPVRHFLPGNKIFLCDKDFTFEENAVPIARRHRTGPGPRQWVDLSGGGGTSASCLFSSARPSLTETFFHPTCLPWLRQRCQRMRTASRLASRHLFSSLPNTSIFHQTMNLFFKPPATALLAQTILLTAPADDAPPPAPSAPAPAKPVPVSKNKDTQPPTH